MSYAVSSVGKVIYNRINGTVPVYPNIAPQGTATPYCVYQILNCESDDVKEGTSWVDTVTVLLTTYEDTQSVGASNADLVRQALDGWAGIVDNVRVDSICYLTESTDFDPGSMKHIISQEFKFRIANT